MGGIIVVLTSVSCSMVILLCKRLGFLYGSNTGSDLRRFERGSGAMQPPSMVPWVKLFELFRFGRRGILSETPSVNGFSSVSFSAVESLRGRAGETAPSLSVSSSEDERYASVRSFFGSGSSSSPYVAPIKSSSSSQCDEGDPVECPSSLGLSLSMFNRRASRSIGGASQTD